MRAIVERRRAARRTRAAAPHPIAAVPRPGRLVDGRRATRCAGAPRSRSSSPLAIGRRISVVLVDADDVAPAVAAASAPADRAEPPHRDRRGRARSRRAGSLRRHRAARRGCESVSGLAERERVGAGAAGRDRARRRPARGRHRCRRRRRRRDPRGRRRRQRGRGRFATARRWSARPTCSSRCATRRRTASARFLAWSVEAMSLAPRRRASSVVNRAPATPVPARASSTRSSRASLPVVDVVFVPLDRRVADAAWDGAPVARGRVHPRASTRSRTVCCALARSPGAARRRSARRDRPHRRLRHHPARRDHGYRAAPAAARSASSARCASRSSARSTTINAGRASATRCRSAIRPRWRSACLRSITELGPLSELLARARRRGGLRRGRAGHLPRHRGPAARARRADDRGREPPDRRSAARGDRAAAERQAPARAGAGARRDRAADRRDRARRRPPLGDGSALHGARRDARRARRARRADRASRSTSCGRSCSSAAGSWCRASPARARRRSRPRCCRRSRRAHCVRSCEEIRELAVPLLHGGYYEIRPVGPRRHRRDQPARPRRSSCWRCGPDRIVVGEVRGAEAFELTRAINAGCGFLCTVHANSARDAVNALVNAALMAGENVTEQIVRRIFVEALDLVVHVDRDDVARTDGHVRRQVTEITAVVPESRRRRDLRADLRARRARPAARMDGRAPARPRATRRPRAARRAWPAPAARARTGVGVKVLGRRARSGPCCALVAGALMGTMPALRLSARRARAARAIATVCGSSRPAPASRPARFWAGSAAAGLFALLVLVALDRLGLRRARAVGRGRAVPARVFRAPSSAAHARGAGGVARRTARHRRVDLGRSFADPGGDLARGDRPARAPRGVRAVPRARARARDRARARAREGGARRPDERPRARGAAPRARTRRPDRADDPRRPRRRDHARSQAARRARDRRARDAHQRACGRGAAVVRARRADRAARPVPRLLPFERRARDAWCSPRSSPRSACSCSAGSDATRTSSASSGWPEDRGERGRRCSRRARSGAGAAGVAGILRPPTRRLAPRVRPYAVVARSALGHVPEPLPARRVARASRTRRCPGCSGPRCASGMARLSGAIESRGDDHLARLLRQAAMDDLTPERYRVQQLATARDLRRSRGAWRSRSR